MSISSQTSAESSSSPESLSGFDNNVARWSSSLTRQPSAHMYSRDDWPHRHLSVMPDLVEASPSSIGQQAMRLMWTTAERSLDNMGMKERYTLRVMHYGAYKSILALYISPQDARDSDLVEKLKPWGEDFLQNKLCNDGQYFMFRVFITGCDGRLSRFPPEPSWRRYRNARTAPQPTEREIRRREKKKRDEIRQREQLELVKLIAAGNYDQALLSFRDVNHIGHRRVTRSQSRLLSAQEGEHRNLPIRL